MSRRSWTSILYVLILIQNVLSFSAPSNNLNEIVKGSPDVHHDTTYKGQNSSNDHFNRRDILTRSLSAIVTTSIAFIPNASNAAVLQSGSCASGEGEACDQLADGNEFIRSLQKKSAENREKNEQVSSFTSIFINNF